MKHRLLQYFYYIIFFSLSSTSLLAQTKKSQEAEPELHFPVAKNQSDQMEDLNEKHPIDLKTPSNITHTVEYNPLTNRYLIYTKLGDIKISSPLVLTPKEYQKYTLSHSMSDYWISKNAEDQGNYEDKFSLTDMHFSLGPAEKVFGPGGVQVRTQGSTELSFSVTRNYVENYTIEERLRTTTAFDYDPSIQLSVNATVGSKMDFNLNYNTESSFDFDQQLMKLSYNGEEDDIIQKIEAGNVSMNLNSQLIKGSTSLFGVRTDLKFGKLSVQAVLSQQKSESSKVNSDGGSQKLTFDVDADSYDADRHFFLAQYFREHYNESMETLPTITSGIEITRIEVWITNTRGLYDQARNILAFEDLGEESTVDNPYWITHGAPYPQNTANSLYNTMSGNATMRDIESCNSALSALGIPSFSGGEDYEKIESARLLTTSEYTLNSSLGFISLTSTLKDDEVLAVAYEYTKGGKVYQVGEFSSDGIESPKTLMVKLLRGTSTSPSNKLWDLMMKNVYYLGGLQVQQDNFDLNVQYKSDSTGVYLNYIPEGQIANKLLIKVLNLDNLDTRNERTPDGKFDFVEGYTILANTGRVIFPVVEPFGNYLRAAIGNDAIADKYCYDELYDSTLVVAQEATEKNKYRLYGKYQATSGSTISLNAMNVSRGSVTVTAGGATLTENVDYTVDYLMGTVTILNQSLLSSGTNIEVNLENQSMFSMTRKTLMGTHLEYAINPDLSVGGTMMYMSEMPIVTKTSYGSEPIANTIWGLNVAYQKDVQWLTKGLDALPFLEASAPSRITASGEVAQLIPGHTEVDNNSGYAYIDDFEAAQTSIDLRYFYYWHLASTPYDPAGGLFPESANSNDPTINENRALFSWFSIDNTVFNSNSSTLMPTYLRNDKDARSNHLTRKIPESEIFPNKDISAGQTSYLSVLNVSYYPKERGPYNLSTDFNTTTGELNNPTQHWGGMMRKLETTDFESANIEYIEFWLMDPFVNDSSSTNAGGELYFDLGNVSEDVLKDGKKFFENGLPGDGDTASADLTTWGYSPTIQSTVLAFDADAASREYQDVGFNGLRSIDEANFPLYKTYIDYLQNTLGMNPNEEPLKSILSDPAGDDYHYYRGTDYDEAELSILDRYKHFNGTEGNSPADGSDGESYATASTSIPDAEDINQDNTLSEYEKYYRYKISIKHSDMAVGTNFITNKVTTDVTLVNGTHSNCTWYQFKIPIKSYEESVGAIKDFKSIRFMRVFMTDFKEEMHLRFGTLALVRGDWRTYSKALYDYDNPPTSVGSMSVSSVSIEENNNKEPVNYVLPPGVTRETDPGQAQMTQQNEQSMLMQVTDLAPGDSRAVYKNLTYDMRQYGRLQMFNHAEKLIDGSELKDYETSVFIRLGSDNSQNYYEYEVPLKLTAPGSYNTNTADEVWPEENMLDFVLSVLTDTKNHRNAQLGTGSSMQVPYSEYDPDHLKNKVTVMGNPNLGEIETIMIGVRNESPSAKDVEVWCNELRLTDYNEDGGWGAIGNMAINLSDLGSITLSGHYETAGFGGVEESIQERRLDDLQQYNFASTFDVGRFFPEELKFKIPVYYSYGVSTSTPQYNPLDGDILMSDALSNLDSQNEKDSLLDIAQTRSIQESFNITNMKMDVRGKRPQLYDPANFSLSYAYTSLQELNPETQRNQTKNYTGSFNYMFNTTPKMWEPFKNSKRFNGNNWALINKMGFTYMPSSIEFSVNVHRSYTETQLRDLTGGYEVDVTDVNNSLLSSGKDFTWDRKFNIKYDPIPNLSLTLNTATSSRIQETLYTPVNKDLFPDEYENWKDTVLSSLRNFGTPLNYSQVFSASYNLPINKVPYLEFITAQGQYSTSYNWQAGVDYDETIDMGNTITNLNNWQFSTKLDLKTLYNKSNFLKRINQEYSTNSNTRSRSSKSRLSGAKDATFKPKTFSKVIKLNPDKPTRIQHHLGTKKIDVIFVDEKNRPVKLRYKQLDRNSIEIAATKLPQVKVGIQTKDPDANKALKKTLDLAIHTLMMVRQVSLTYQENSSLMLPGYSPEVDLFGQTNVSGSKAPGYEFAFGRPNTDYLDEAMDKGWIVINDDVTTPATYNKSMDLDLKMTLEPLVGLSVTLAAKRTTTDQSSIQYMYDGMPSTYSGSFSQTFMCLGTSFWSSGDAGDNYNSKAFNNFIANRTEVQNKLNANYRGVTYPNSGFIADDGSYVGKTYDESVGNFSLNSSDVLIPAFLAAYSDRSVSSIGTSPFLALAQLLPNWKITYDGLTKIPLVNKYLKKATLSHAYTCTYNVGSFGSYANYVETDDGFGFINDVTTGNPIPSMKYDIATVSISENFAPLIGVDVAFYNNFTTKFEYRRQRTIALNLASSQITEAKNNEYIVGFGYIIKDFDVILKLKDNRQRKVQNNLTTKLDVGIKDISTLLRRIDETSDTQATSGNKTITIKASADYVFSQRLNVKFFCDYQTNTPYISTSYPMNNLNVGFSLKLMLTQ